MFGATIDVLALFYNGWTFGKDVCTITGTLVTTSGKNPMSHKIHKIRIIYNNIHRQPYTKKSTL